MSTRAGSAFSVGLFLSALIGAHATAAEVDHLQQLLEVVSSGNLSSLSEAKDITWPLMNIPLSADPTVRDGSEASKVSRSLALRFLDLLRNHEGSFYREPPSQDGTPFEVYSLLGERLEKAGGSLNLCLLDSINRCAMARLCHSVLSASLEVESARSILESLHVPKCDKSFLEDLMSTRMSQDQAVKLFADLPPTRLRQAVFNFEGYGLDYVEAMVKVSPKLKTSVLVAQESISPLVSRLTESWGLHSVLFPGLLDFLSKGGKTKDLPDLCGNFPKFMELMGPSFRDYRFEPEGQVYLRPSDLLFLVREFEGDFRKSKYYRKALD